MAYSHSGHRSLSGVLKPGIRLYGKMNYYYTCAAPRNYSPVLFTAQILRGGIPNDKLKPSNNFGIILIAEVLCTAIQIIFRKDKHEDS